MESELRSDFQKDMDELLAKHYPDNEGYIIAVALSEGIMVFGKAACMFDTFRMAEAVNQTFDRRLDHAVTELVKRMEN